MTVRMRFPDWPKRLADHVESMRDKPFAYGSNDCALFAAGAIEAITGDDLASDLRGRYTTALGAKRRINAAGGMRALASDLPEKPVGMAQRGDVVLAMSEGQETFGVVVGGGYWCAPGPDGLVFRPMDEAVAAFEV